MLNFEILKSNLAEAKEQLDCILQSLDEVDYEESELLLDFMHMYHHINSAWNGRHARSDYLTTFTNSEFNKDQQFPVDDFEFMTVDEQ